MLTNRLVHKRLTKQHFHLSKKIAQHCFEKKHIIRSTKSRVIIDEKHVYNINFDFKGIILKNHLLSLLLLVLYDIREYLIAYH